MGMKQKAIDDPAFAVYGRVISGYDCEELLKKMNETPLPEDVIYVPSVAELEMLPIAKQLERNLYGQMPIQIGYCNGHNRFLNAVEYHRDSEVNIAGTDLVLILGREQDITEDYTYDTAKMEAFFVPAGTVLEVYATTLHYAPCHVQEEGFRCVVVLPKDTNTELAAFEVQGEEDKLLFARNKWLIGHREGGLPERAYLGLIGENRSI
ncbi:MAG: DUF4867 family protein [Hungatella sp.]